jgi:hypothetical protein
MDFRFEGKLAMQSSQMAIDQVDFCLKAAHDINQWRDLTIQMLISQVIIAAIQLG